MLLPETRLSIAPPANPLDTQFAAPLRRSGPQRLGLNSWGSYTLVLRWTPEGRTRVVLGARLVEPKPGDFQYYYVAVGDGQATLGLCGPKGDKVLASKAYAGGSAAQQLDVHPGGAEPVGGAWRRHAPGGHRFHARHGPRAPGRARRRNRRPRSCRQLAAAEAASAQRPTLSLPKGK